MDDDEYNSYRMHYEYNARTTTMPPSYSYSEDSEELSPTTSLMQRVLLWLDQVTSPRFGLLVAVLVIVLCNHQDAIRQWARFYFGQEDVTVTEALIVLAWQALDVGRACCQITWNFVHNLLGGGGLGGGNHHRGRRMNIGHRKAVMRDRSSTCSSLPELEETAAVAALSPSGPSDDNIGGTVSPKMPQNSSPLQSRSEADQDEASSTSPPHAAVNGGRSEEFRRALIELSDGYLQLDMDKRSNSGEAFFGNVANGASFKRPPPHPVELAPAFLSTGQYPDGWKVFHPMLGVVSKSDLDAFMQSTAVDEQFDTEASSRRSRLCGDEANNKRHVDVGPNNSLLQHGSVASDTLAAALDCNAPSLTQESAPTAVLSNSNAAQDDRNNRQGSMDTSLPTVRQFIHAS